MIKILIGSVFLIEVVVFLVIVFYDRLKMGNFKEMVILWSVVKSEGLNDESDVLLCNFNKRL